MQLQQNDNECTPAWQYSEVQSVHMPVKRIR